MPCDSLSEHIFLSLNICLCLSNIKSLNLRHIESIYFSVVCISDGDFQYVCTRRYFVGNAGSYGDSYGDNDLDIKDAWRSYREDDKFYWIIRRLISALPLCSRFINLFTLFSPEKECGIRDEVNYGRTLSVHFRSPETDEGLLAETLEEFWSSNRNSRSLRKILVDEL